VPQEDRLGTIDLHCVFECRAIVPNGSARRIASGSWVFRLFPAWRLDLSALRLRRIDWGQSIYTAFSSVEPLSPMARRDA
jgi:hypothetical protein